MPDLDGLLGKITDPYDRKARLYPALLALSPLLVTSALLHGAEIASFKGGITLIVSCGGLYLLSNLCREQGRRVEKEFYKEWGGKPTTQLLRHRETTIEALTKSRYHAFLASKIDHVFPSAEEENADPSHADQVYQSGVRWLLSNRPPQSAKTDEIVFRENTAYGFRRNAFGIRPLGLVIAVGTPVWLLAKQHVFLAAKPFFDQENLMRIPESAAVSLAFSGLMVCVWLFFFTKANVRSAAFTYAEALFRFCDVL